MSIKSTIDDLRKYRNLVLVVFLFCMISTLSFLAARNMTHSSAASLSGFKPGNIISDAVMGNYNAMTKDEIQAFLTKKNPCNNKSASQYQSLKSQYPNLDWHFENGHFVCLSEEKFGDGTTIGEGQTAAGIIYQAAQDYKINPQVLIVLLEKEQSLITDTYPNTKQYRSATGYGCPDTAACDTKYYGFKNQVRNAAALFRNVLDNGYYAYPEKKSGVYIGYNPNSACGRSEVYIENRATAALYRYTPYQPNAAALAAGTGTGDSCSAYGNRNFYIYFTDWFGSTQASIEGSPITIPDGEYTLVSALAPKYSITASNNNAQLVENSKAQRWRFTRNSLGYYVITNLTNNQNLDLYGAYAVNGVNVQTYAANESCAQQWRLYGTSDGYITIESACSTNMVLDVQDANGKAGANIQIFIANNGKNQKWALHTGQVLPDGLYAVQPSQDTSKAIDVSGGNVNNGANALVWSSHLGVSQQWRFQYHADGDYYTIMNPNSQKMLDLSGGIATAGRNIQIWQGNSSCAQRWRIVPNGKEYYLMTTCSNGHVIDTAGQKITDGQNIQLASYNGAKSQSWRFTKLSPVIKDGTYILQSSLAKVKAVDIYGGYTVAGTNIELFDAHSGAGQQWEITYNVATDDYSLYNSHTNKYLDLYGGYTQSGTNVQTWHGNNGCGQRWRIEKESDGSYTIISACDGSKALDLYGGYTQNRTNIQLWDKHGGNSQKWYLTAVKSST